MPESALSRLARSTELSKIESPSARAARLRSRRTHYESESGCPRNLLTISFARYPVNLHIPQHLHMISTWAECRNGTRDAGSKFQSFAGFRVSSFFGTLKLCHFETSFAQKRATVWPSALDLQHTPIFGARRSGRQKIEKRT